MDVLLVSVLGALFVLNLCQLRVLLTMERRLTRLETRRRPRAAGPPGAS
jgi:hypothetical protein